MTKLWFFVAVTVLEVFVLTERGIASDQSLRSLEVRISRVKQIKQISADTHHQCN